MAAVQLVVAHATPTVCMRHYVACVPNTISPPLPLPPAPQQAKPAGAAAAIGMQINFGSDERMTAQQE